jgi:hypothetical protein
MQNVYQIGMHIALAGNALAGLQAISRALAGIHGQVGQIHSGWRNWAAILGVGGIAAGVGIIGGLKTIASHGDKLIDQQVKLTNQGYKQNEVLKLQADYYDRIARAVPTSTIAGYLKTTNELRSVTGEGPEGLAKAGELAIKAMKIDALLSNTFGTNKEGSYYNLLRSEEMKGIATNDARRDQMTDAAMSYISAFGGKLTADDFQNMARTGGAAFMNADVAKSMGPLAVMAADLHGGPAGTALMTLQQFQTGAHTLSKQQAGVLEQLGLLDMSKTTKTGFGGSRLQLAPGAMTGALQYSGDLPGWIREVVWPAIMKEAHGDKAVAESLLGKMFPNRNANKAAHMFGDEGFADQIAKDMGLAKQALPWEEQYKNFIEKNPLGVKQGFHDQFESMMQSIGGPLAQAAIPVMKSMTEIFTSIGKWANTNPETIKIVGIGLTFLAAGLIALGATAVIAAAAAMAPTAAIGIAVVAIAGFIGTLAALNWDIVKQGLGAVTGFIQGWVDKFKEWVGGKGNGPTDPSSSGLPVFGGAYHPGGGANDNYSWSDMGQGKSGVGAGSGGGTGGASLIDAIHRGGGGFNSRGVNNRNLGNIGYGPWARAHGAVGAAGRDSGHGVAIFGSFSAGRNAARSLALSKYLSGRRSIDALVAGAGGWTPGNHQAAANIARMMGIGANADAHLGNAGAMDRFLDALSVQELGPAGARHYRERVLNERSKKAITEGVTPPPRKESQPIIQFEAHLDREVLSRAVTRGQSQMAYFPSSDGDIDIHGRYHHAGQRMADVG